MISEILGSILLFTLLILYILSLVALYFRKPPPEKSDSESGEIAEKGERTASVS